MASIFLESNQYAIVPAEVSNYINKFEYKDVLQNSKVTTKLDYDLIESNSYFLSKTIFIFQLAKVIGKDKSTNNSITDYFVYYYKVSADYPQTKQIDDIPFNEEVDDINEVTGFIFENLRRVYSLPCSTGKSQVLINIDSEFEIANLLVNKIDRNYLNCDRIISTVDSFDIIRDINKILEMHRNDIFTNFLNTTNTRYLLEINKDLDVYILKVITNYRNKLMEMTPKIEVEAVSIINTPF